MEDKLSIELFASLDAYLLQSATSLALASDIELIDEFENLRPAKILRDKIDTFNICLMSYSSI
jgi:hypothetical protein